MNKFLKRFSCGLATVMALGAVGNCYSMTQDKMRVLFGKLPRMMTGATRTDVVTASTKYYARINAGGGNHNTNIQTLLGGKSGGEYAGFAGLSAPGRVGLYLVLKDENGLVGGDDTGWRDALSTITGDRDLSTNTAEINRCLDLLGTVAMKMKKLSAKYPNWQTDEVGASEKLFGHEKVAWKALSICKLDVLQKGIESIAKLPKGSNVLVRPDDFKKLKASLAANGIDIGALVVNGTKICSADGNLNKTWLDAKNADGNTSAAEIAGALWDEAQTPDVLDGFSNMWLWARGDDAPVQFGNSEEEDNLRDRLREANNENDALYTALDNAVANAAAKGIDLDPMTGDPR